MQKEQYCPTAWLQLTWNPQEGPLFQSVHNIFPSSSPFKGNPSPLQAEDLPQDSRDGAGEGHCLGSPIAGRESQSHCPKRPGRAEGEQELSRCGQQRCCWFIFEARRSYFCKSHQAQEFKSLPGNLQHVHPMLPWRQGQPELIRDEIIRQNTSCKIIKGHLISEARTMLQ